MKTFNEGDRVNHPRHGAGTVVHPYKGTGSTTVDFDSEGKIMTETAMLSAVPDTVPFKKGDRVVHQLHGTATVAGVASKLVEIVPTGYGTPVYVHPISLTLASEGAKFKIGDRVSHPLHRDGTVENYSEHSGLYTVDVGRARAYYTLGDEITHAVPEPTYHICIEEITGAAHVPRKLTAKEVAEYIADNVNWRVVQEIKITKEGD